MLKKTKTEKKAINRASGDSKTEYCKIKDSKIRGSRIKISKNRFVRQKKLKQMAEKRYSNC